MNASGQTSASSNGNNGSAFKKPSYKRSVAMISASGIVLGLGFSGGSQAIANPTLDCVGNTVTPATADIPATADTELVTKEEQNTNNISNEIREANGIVCLNGDFEVDGRVYFNLHAKVYGLGNSSITSPASAVFQSDRDINNEIAFDIEINNLSILDSEVAVYARDVDIRNGSTLSGNDGAIRAERNASISSSTLTDNEVSDGDGGAIYALGNVTISNSSLTNNSASSDNGGAIYAEGNVAISNSTLTGNSARWGGAISASGEVSISNSSTLSANSANDHGGAIEAGGNVSISGSTLSLNESGTGGAIYSYNEGGVTISISTLSGNVATSGGGAIWSDGPSFFDNTIFSGNISGDQGGAIHTLGNSTFTNNSTLTSNRALEGGAIYMSSYRELNIINSSLTDNYAQFQGGAVKSLSLVVISSSTLSENESDTEGGAVWSNSSVTISTNSTLNDNDAESDGGAVMTWGSVSVSNSTLSGNLTTASGGALWINGNSTIENSTFSSNYAEQGGGGAIRGYGTINTTKSTFANNTAYEGGALYGFRNGDGGRVEVSSSTFFGNRAYTPISVGGAISAYDGEVVFSTFVNNTASTSQGEPADTPGNSIYKTGEGQFELGANIFAGTFEHPQLGAGSSPTHFTDLGGNLFSTSSSDESDIAEDPELDPELQVKHETSVFSKSLLSIFGTATPTLRTFSPNSSGTQMLGLAAGSPALGIVPNSPPFTSFTQDQRGTTRTFPSSAGAFEGVAPVEPTPTPTSAPVALAKTGSENPFWLTLGAGLVTALGSMAAGVSHKLRRRTK